MAKGTPIHIMRWAPADYVNDPIVKLALARRDLVASTFYPLFLFHAFMEGGSLPASAPLLAAIVGMRAADVQRAVAFWTEHGKLQEQDGRLFHHRIKREIARELEYREEQAELGRKGGRVAGKGRPLTDVRGTPMGSIGPPASVPAPAPSSAPTPAPASVPDCAGFPASREADLEAPAPDDVRRELVRLAAEGAASPWGEGRDGQQLIAAASMIGDRCIDNPYSPYLKRAWVEATISRLRQMRAVFEARNPRRQATPPNPASAWIEANGGAEELARECAEACGWDPEAKAAREAWFELRAMPLEAWASIVWLFRRVIDEHRRGAIA